MYRQAHRVLKLGNNNIAGIVMEKANGANVVKTLKRDGFCNVRRGAHGEALVAACSNRCIMHHASA
jgi:hypothetical protein